MSGAQLLEPSSLFPRVCIGIGRKLELRVRARNSNQVFPWGTEAAEILGQAPTPEFSNNVFQSPRDEYGGGGVLGGSQNPQSFTRPAPIPLFSLSVS